MSNNSIYGLFGLPTQRDVQKTETRALLLEKALYLFSRHGVTAVRTIDLAKEAGVSHGTVFAHFDKREDLISSVIVNFGKKCVQGLHRANSKTQKLPQVLEAHLAGIRDVEPFYCFLLREKWLLPREASNTLLGIQSAISFHIYRSLKSEKNEQYLNDYPMHLVFNTWIGLLHHYLGNKEFFAPEGSVIERYGKELLGHFLRLVQY